MSHCLTEKQKNLQNLKGFKQEEAPSPRVSNLRLFHPHLVAPLACQSVTEYRNDDIIKIYFWNFHILTPWSERAVQNSIDNFK